MAQLFRDQCRDAWRDGRGWGLTVALAAGLAGFGQNVGSGTHLNTQGKENYARKNRHAASSAVCAAVSSSSRCLPRCFCSWSPRARSSRSSCRSRYSSTARVLVKQDASEASQKAGLRTPLGPYDPYFLQTQFEVIQSEAVLGKVIDDLDLNQAWGRKYAGGSPLKTSETLALLKARARPPPRAQHQPDRNPRLQRRPRRSGAVGERHRGQLPRIPVGHRPRPRSWTRPFPA